MHAHAKDKKIVRRRQRGYYDRKESKGFGAWAGTGTGTGVSAEKEVKFEKAERNSITMLKYCQILALR